MKKWAISEFDADQISELSKKLNISPVLAKLLTKRGYTDSDRARSFLKKELNSFHSPYLMKDVESGVKLLLETIDRNGKILIWGDYDVDGVTSVTVLLKYIVSIGGICEYYIPKRDDDGYGLNGRVLTEYVNNGTKLLITVDSGITAVKEIQQIKDMGIKAIITDHHECRDEIPNADAVINPKRHDCTYPFKELAGVGVVFKFICAVEMLKNNCSCIQASDKIMQLYSEFIAIGTIADVMPLSDENRIIVSRGLQAIESTRNIGLSALCTQSGIEPSGDKKKKISSTTVGFVLAPRINAAGRMESSKIAVDLLTTESRETAAKLAARLDEINKQRQALENESLTSALEKINTQCDILNDKVLVLSDDNWHHGIIGIVSSRITEKYNLPSVLISFKNEIMGSDPEIGKGSARSIKGMNLVNALSSCSGLLQKFGGHELAAGLSIKKSNLEEFREKINEYAKKAFEDISLDKCFDIDCELTADDLNIRIAHEIIKLEPFGLSNPVPVFATLNMKIGSIIPIGEGKHTKLLLERNGRSYVALLFGTPSLTFDYSIGDFVDVAYNLDINSFRNQQNIQMVVRDIKPSKADMDIMSQHVYKYEKLISDDNAEVVRSDIPTRTDFAHIYTVLKDMTNKVSSVTEHYDLYIPRLLKQVNSTYSTFIPLYKALIMLDVLSETSLIESSVGTSEFHRMINCKPKALPQGKVILENTPTIRKLFSKLKNN